jgi:hypothetical protein
MGAADYFVSEQYHRLSAGQSWVDAPHIRDP